MGLLFKFLLSSLCKVFRELPCHAIRKIKPIFLTQVVWSPVLALHKCKGAANNAATP